MSIHASLAHVIAPKPTGISGFALVRTPCGARRAESIRPGDLVVTKDYGLQPVQMVWTSLLSTLAKPSEGNRVLKISKRAIGPMMPESSLAIGADQLVWLPAYLLSNPTVKNGGLIPARGLVGRNALIAHDLEPRELAFYNFCFRRHFAFSASGLYVTSYRPLAREMELVDARLRDRLIRCYPELVENRDPIPPSRYNCVTCDAYSPESA